MDSAKADDGRAATVTTRRNDPFNVSDVAHLKPEDISHGHAAHTHASGATSSHLAPDYGSIPESLLRRLGERFAVGTVQHGRGSWSRAFVLGIEHGTSRWRYDIDFLRDRYNHGIEHLLALRQGTKDDDHIGAVAWFLAFAAYAETCGVDWAEALATRTPEDEAEYRRNYHVARKAGS